MNADHRRPLPYIPKRRAVMPKLLRGEPITGDLPLSESLRRTPYREPQVREEPNELAERRRRLDLAVRVGELLLRGGAATRDVENSVVAVAASMGLRRLEVDITNQSLLVQCPGATGEPLTALRVVRSSTRDFARLAAVHEFVERIVSGSLALEPAIAELKELQRQRRMYPRWVVTVGTGGLAGSVSALLGAGWVAIAVSVVAAMLIDRIGRKMALADLPDFYIYAVGGLISTLMSWGAFVLTGLGDTGFAMTPSDFAYAVAGGIVVQLPGRAMTSAVEDTVTGYPVTGSGRMFVAALTTAGLIVGVAAGLSMALRIDNQLDLNLATPDVQLSFATQETALALIALCGAVGAVSSSLTMRTRPRMLLPTACLGVLGVVLSQGLTRYGGIGATTAVALAAIAVGLVGRTGAVRLGAPSLVLIGPAVAPMLPGLRIFQGMYDLVSGLVLGTENTQGQGLTTLLGAAGVALAISTGVVLGDLLGARFDRSAVMRRRARRR
ncbi:threonine/serine ThrE exporter family protein [Dermacoccaceae bacterium W4C1]